jgi:hypothetical protein
MPRRISKAQFYVYSISIDGIVRYIGKGSNGRVNFHVIEARRINARRDQGANTNATTTKFYRNLAEALRRRATITEKILRNRLTDKEAYRIEKQQIEELYKQNRDQLWNSVDERFIGISWKEFKMGRLALTKIAPER